MLDAQPAERRELVWRRLSWLAVLLLAGWLVSLAFHHFQGAVLGRPYPYNTFFFDPRDRYGDLLNSWRQAQSDNPYFKGGTPAVATWFPLVYFVLSLARKLAPEAVLLIYSPSPSAARSCLCFLWLREQRPLWKDDARWPAIILFATLLGVVNYPLLFASTEATSIRS